MGRLDAGLVQEAGEKPLPAGSTEKQYCSGCLSSGAAGIIGTLGAVGMARIGGKSKGVIEYISMVPIMIPEIILGMVFMAFLLCC